MSVTFFVEIDESAPRVFALECADGVRRETRTGDYAAMAGLYECHQLTCEVEDCRVYGPALELEGEFGPEVNVASGNARTLLAALGCDTEEMCGDAEGADFLGRVLMALAVAPADAGVPAHRMVPGEMTIFGEVREGGATFLDCGRPAGYLQERLVELEEVARAAIAAGRKVVWG